MARKQSASTGDQGRETPWRIAMLGQKSIPSRAGGVELVVQELSCGMVRRGHQVTCYNRTYPPVDQKRAAFQQVRLRWVPTLPHRGLAALSASAVGALCAAVGRYDMVHFHAEGPCAMLWLPKLLGKRCVATIHGLDWQRSKWGRLASAYLRLGEWMAAKWADEVIVLSPNTQRYFQERYHRETVYIPNGVNPMPWRPAEQITARWGLRQGDYLLYLGRIVPEKGLLDLVKAFQKVQTDKRLVIAGGASDTEAFYRQLQQAAQSDPRICFTGFVEGQILEELYSNAYLYCLPSQVEGMPLSLLEAMSYGLCCVTSDLPECTQVTGPYGHVFPKGDTDQLRQVLQELVAAPQRVLAQREARSAHVCRAYDWDRIVEETLAVYQKALGRTETKVEDRCEDSVGQ